MEKTIAEFTIKPLYLAEGSTPLGKWVLRKFQEQVYKNIMAGRNTLLEAPTGSGKTLTLLLGREGAVGLYPNNTLLLDQQKSIEKIITTALGAKLVASVDIRGTDILKIYETGHQHRGELPITAKKRIAVVLLSGRYIGYEYNTEGRLQPKRVTVLRKIVEKICYPAKGEEPPYTIVLGTPDTALMIMTGIYRDFEKVGYTIHNAFISSARGTSIDWDLSKYGVATVRELGDLAEIRQCLLQYPWFIDEFHLYGLYETTGLLPVLRVFQDYAGWEEPVILSSATPKGPLYERLREKPVFTTVRAYSSPRGDPNSLVREETSVEVVEVEAPGRGSTKWLQIGFQALRVLAQRLREVEDTVARGGSVFIVVDRVNQVPGIIDVLAERGLRAECSVSIKPPGCSDKEEKIVVGSESISQGIDRENVRYGIITAYNWASLIQRFGRIGRRTRSKTVIIVPRMAKEIPLAGLDGATISYEEFVDIVRKTYPSTDFSQGYETKRVRQLLEKRSKLIEYTTVIGFAKSSGTSRVLEALAQKLAQEVHLLNLFYGPPESIAGILTFRGSGFPVVVEKPGAPGDLEETEIGIVLRNYSVEKVTITTLPQNGLTKKMAKLAISFEPSRMKLVLEPSHRVREDLAEHLSGTITTIGELVSLGFHLKIKPIDPGSPGKAHELPKTVDISTQAIAILDLPEEIANYYIYTVRGIEVKAGEKRVVALFM